jgi:hypothetical protein
MTRRMVRLVVLATLRNVTGIRIRSRGLEPQLAEGRASDRNPAFDVPIILDEIFEVC